MKVSKVKYINTVERNLGTSLNEFAPEGIGSLVKKREGAPKGKLRHTYNCRDNTDLASKIFKTFMVLAINRVIEGDIMKLTGNAKIYVNSVRPEKVNKIKREKKFFRFINFRATKNKLYFLKYSFGEGATNKYDFNIVVSKEMYRRFVYLQNSGKQYPVLKKRFTCY